jgi:uncharacterized cupin superfamily protein/8-oxo-dGTP pyrophosphatase MutT (NUDIX family)
MEKKEKVLAYIYRKLNHELQVLVFDHPGVPEVNPQVPSGTLKDGEKPEEGVLREVLEETGLEFDAIDHYHGRFDFIAKDMEEHHSRDVFSIMTDGLPDSWSHTVQSQDGDNGEVFDFYWLPLEIAKSQLVAEQGNYLPMVNGHFVSSFDIAAEYYNEDLKIGGLNANISKYFGLNRVAAHYFKIPNGYRTSEPHAEKLEEEFVFVISGEIDLWLNGKIKKMSKGDCIGFPAGTGVGHCFINNSGADCELFVSGDRTKPDNQCHFHLDPSLAKECGDFWWSDMPKQELGGHDGLPGNYDSSLVDNEIDILNGYDNFSEETFSYPKSNEKFVNTVYLSRHFKMKNIAINLVRMPVGRRSSWPHAHFFEEEFVFVLRGNPTVRLDGKDYEATPFTGIDFKAGSGVAHTIVNTSNDFIYYLCLGECDAREDKIYYPDHPARNEEVRAEGWLWEDLFA